jgi:hypothetical protein
MQGWVIDHVEQSLYGKTTQMWNQAGYATLGRLTEGSFFRRKVSSQKEGFENFRDSTETIPFRIECSKTILGHLKIVSSQKADQWTFISAWPSTPGKSQTGQLPRGNPCGPKLKLSHSFQFLNAPIPK